MILLCCKNFGSGEGMSMGNCCINEYSSSSFCRCCLFLNEERLWTPYDNLAKDPRQVTGRLAHFRCLLNQRGIAAAPLAGPGRVAPVEPGSCYTQ